MDSSGYSSESFEEYQEAEEVYDDDFEEYEPEPITSTGDQADEPPTSTATQQQSTLNTPTNSDAHVPAIIVYETATHAATTAKYNEASTLTATMATTTAQQSKVHASTQTHPARTQTHSHTPHTTLKLTTLPQNNYALEHTTRTRNMPNTFHLLYHFQKMEIFLQHKLHVLKQHPATTDRVATTQTAPGNCISMISFCVVYVRFVLVVWVYGVFVCHNSHTHSLIELSERTEHFISKKLQHLRKLHQQQQQQQQKQDLEDQEQLSPPRKMAKKHAQQRQLQQQQQPLPQFVQIQNKRQHPYFTNRKLDMLKIDTITHQLQQVQHK